MPEKNLIILELEQNKKKIKSIGFNLYDEFYEQVQKIYFDQENMCEMILNGYLDEIDLLIDIVYNPEVNEFNQKIYLQLRLKDFILKRGA